MQIVRTPHELTTAVRRFRADNRSVALVPTMGALHRGHQALMSRGLTECDELAVTIFVNPKQFNDPDDFHRYPSTIDDDLDVCRRSGASIAYVPTTESMYPPGFVTNVHVDGVGDDHEGRSRPGHFDGVSTVVTKLLVAAEADVAVFGQKDYQQVAVVRRLVSDLDIPTTIVVEPTVRDDDGLAMSSRNSRLSSRARTIALAIPRALERAHELVESGVESAPRLEHELTDLLESAGLRVDYVRVVDRSTLQVGAVVRGESVLLVAAEIDGVRLIDNIEL